MIELRNIVEIINEMYGKYEVDLKSKLIYIRIIEQL